MTRRQKHEEAKEELMKKIGLIGGAFVIIIAALFMWALSGASDKHAPTEVQTIDVSPQL
jgi:hypothetical protein